MGSGRYLVAGSQVPGTKSAEGEGEREGGGFGLVSSGRQAADNNQAWTADRRTQDWGVQSAEHG